MIQNSAMKKWLLGTAIATSGTVALVCAGCSGMKCYLDDIRRLEVLRLEQNAAERELATHRMATIVTDATKTTTDTIARTPCDTLNVVMSNVQQAR